MPAPDQILTGLSTIANQWQNLAIAWHVYFGVLLVGLILGVRPTKRVGGILLGLPLLSVSALAYSSANAFNGTLFALTAVALIAVATRLPDERVHVASAWVVSAGYLCLFSVGSIPISWTRLRFCPTWLRPPRDWCHARRFQLSSVLA